MDFGVVLCYDRFLFREQRLYLIGAGVSQMLEMYTLGPGPVKREGQDPKSALAR